MIIDHLLDERPRWVREVAASTGVSTSSIYRWRRAGLVECEKVDHKICLMLSTFKIWLGRYLSRPDRRGALTVRERQQKQLRVHLPSAEPDNLDPNVRE
jgi:hypothetical protein